MLITLTWLVCAPAAVSLPVHARELPPRDAFGRDVRSSAGTPLVHGPSQQLALQPQSSGSVVGASGSASHASSLGAPGELVWSYVGFGAGIGIAGIRTSLGAGPKEIYLGSSNTTFGGNVQWMALRHAASGNYEQVWSSGFSSAGFVALDVGDVLIDAGPEIVTLESNGLLTVRDQATKAIRAQFNATLPAPGAMKLVDVDGDARAEILLCSSNALHIYSGSGSLIFQRTGMGGSDLCVGQMDADASLEIATTDGHVLDYASNTFQCTWPNAFGFRIEAIDFDSDGKDELVYAEPWSFVWAFDVDTCLPKWSINNFNTGAIRIADADHDGTRELIVGDAQWGDVHAFDLVTQAPKWRISNPEHGTTNVWVDDVDGDTQVEVLWGAGATSSGADRLYVGSALTQTIEWQNEQLDGPWVGPARGDLDGDGQDELVVVSESSDAGYGAPRIVVFDATTLDVRAISQETSQNLGWEGVGQVRLRDVDGDADLEIAIATCTTYDGLIEIYDFSAGGTFTRIWSNATRPFGAVFRTVEIADLDGNGSLEVLGGVAGAHTGSLGTFVYAYSLATGAELWHTFALSPGTFTGVSALEVVDADHDGQREVLAVVRGGSFWIFDGATHTPEAQFAGPFDDLRSWARTSLQAPAILLAQPSGSLALYRYQGGSYVNFANFTNPGGALNGLDIGRGAALAVGQSDRLELMLPLPSPAWTSAPISPGIGRGTVFQPSFGRLVTTGALGVFALRLF